MDPASRALVVTYLAQVLLGAVQAGILAHFHRLSRQSYLRWWTWSFVALCIYHACAAAAFVWVASGVADPVSRLLWTWTSQIAVYVQVTLLLVGSVQIAAASPLPRATAARLVWAAAGLGTAVSLAYAFDDAAAGERLWLRVGLRYLLCSAAFMATALLLWRRRGRHPGMGPAMVALAFASYGLLLSFEFGLFVLQWAQHQRIAGAELLCILDLVAQACIGFGLIIWVAEDEHRRADQAAQEADRARRFDAATGLLNRVEMERLIQSDLAADDPPPLALFVIEFVGLNRLTRAFAAHQVDAILREASERLQQPGGAGGLRVGRLDTHRLLVSVTEAGAGSGWERLALDWLARLRGRYDGAADAGVIVECAIGISVAPGDGTEAGILLAHAERASHDTRQPVAFYSPERDRELRRRLALAEESLAGLRAGQIVPYFQPVVGADGMAVASFEVLARWCHPSRGVLLPADFLPVLEDRGALAELDRHMLVQACLLATQLKVPRIAVNVSAHGFESADLLADVRHALEASALDAHCLCLEITESTALGDLQHTRALLMQLRALGVTIALDDFGTGYSSLAHLRELPIDSIKIDRAFVQAALGDAKTAAIVESVVTLAQRLHLQVVVEGVETPQELDYFRRLGVTLFQGWLIAPAHAFETARELMHLPPHQDRSAGTC